MNELTEHEKTILGDMERIITNIDAMFVIHGLALMAIRDSRLYRETHSNFDSYCEEYLQTPKRNINMLILAATSYYEIKFGSAKWDPMDPIFDYTKKIGTENGIHWIPFSEQMPKNERQIRPITAIKNAEDKQKCWQEIIASGEKITADLVAKYAAKYTSGKTIDAKPSHTPPSADWVKRNPPPTYKEPSKSDAMNYSGIHFDITGKLPPIVGAMATLIYIDLVQFAFKQGWSKGKTKHLCVVTDAELMTQTGCTKRTIEQHRKKLIEFFLITAEEKSDGWHYKINDFQWAINAIGKQYSADEPETQTDTSDETELADIKF
jgi:hypothetical protein